MKKLSETLTELGIAFTFPIEIKHSSGNWTYYEQRDGFWSRAEYDDNGNRTYYEDSDKYWRKSEYDSNGKKTYYEDSNGYKTGTPKCQSCDGKVIEFTIDGKKYMLKEL